MKMQIPPSAALAGSVYKTVMAQVTAGKKYGSMSEVDCFDARYDKRWENSFTTAFSLFSMVQAY